MKQPTDTDSPFNITWTHNTKIIQIIPGTDWFAVGKDSDGDLVAEPIVAFGLTEHGDIYPLSFDEIGICQIAPDGFQGSIRHRLQMTEAQLSAIL